MGTKNALYNTSILNPELLEETIEKLAVVSKNLTVIGALGYINSVDALTVDDIAGKTKQRKATVQKSIDDLLAAGMVYENSKSTYKLETKRIKILENTIQLLKI